LLAQEYFTQAAESTLLKEGGEERDSVDDNVLLVRNNTVSFKTSL
jgi:hypothetical protein